MIKKGSLSYSILLSLEKSIEAGATVADFLDEPHRWAFTGYRKNINYGSLHRAIQRLRKEDFIETPKDGHRILLKLTDKGRQTLILKKLLEDNNWDGKWRLVIFDIPEKHKKLRNVFRARLRQWQFVPWQKSVWASKKNIAIELRNFIKETQLENWVKVVVSSDVD